MKFSKIHKDDRGSISLLHEDMKLDEVTVFETNAGYARGGCVHNINDEYVTVIEGDVIYVTDGLVEYMSMGDNLTVHAGMPHYFISVTDSIVMEWGATPKEKKEKHTEYRRVVDEFNSRGNNGSDQTSIQQ